MIRAVRAALAAAVLVAVAMPPEVSEAAGRKRSSIVAQRKPAPAQRRTPRMTAAQAFYSGDAAQAFRLANASGERWIGGLAAFRLKDFDAARTRFEAVAADTSEDEWLRSGAAFWAARSAIAGGRPELAPAYLMQAASTPWTFYGLIAEAQLGLEPAIRFNQAIAQPGPTGAADPLAQLLIRVSSAPAATDFSANAAFSSQIASDYPIPSLQPKYGFTLEPALVYAIVRQESRFNPEARSPAGAIGLMQLMPEAAARAAGDDKLKSDMSPLLDPAFNLRVGQDYFIWLLERGVGDDVLRAVAAYNGGPGTLLRTVNQIGADDDALMVIESLPAQETRAYVEKVMAGYWLYSRQFGQESDTLAQVAAGASRVPAVRRQMEEASLDLLGTN